jgi:hypothetical protein
MFWVSVTSRFRLAMLSPCGREGDIRILIIVQGEGMRESVQIMYGERGGRLTGGEICPQPQRPITWDSLTFFQPLSAKSARIGTRGQN